MIKKTTDTKPKNKNDSKTDEENSFEDYQLSRAFDLILALNLTNKTTQ